MTLPVDVQIRDDAAFGRAWRRAEAALPEGWELAVASTDQADLYSAGSYDRNNRMQEAAHRATPAAALEALAEALEAKKENE